MLTRLEFAQYFNSLRQGLGDPDSPLWDIEEEPCNYFIAVKPVNFWDEEGTKPEYWDWCNKYCKGKLVCYSSSDEEEWWGFTDQQDILLWTLRWA